MAHKFVAEISQFVAGLRSGKEAAESLLGGMPNIKNRVIADLNKLDNYLCFIGGIKREAQTERKKFGEIKREEQATPQESTPVKTPMELEAQKLQEEVDLIYPDFINRQTDELLDTLTDMQLRAVAKKAGLPVTETNPDRIDNAYIDQIKGLMKAQRELVANTEVAQLTDPALQELNLQLQDNIQKKEQLEKTTIPVLEKKIARMKSGEFKEAAIKELEEAKNELVNILGWIDTYQTEINSLSGNQNQQSAL